MSGSRIARRQSRNHARYRGRNDINIVPMLDVMVILIFFLIFTAVFSKMNILELNLPVDGGPPPELPAVLELEVIVRGNVIEVADRNTGLLQRLPNLADGADYDRPVELPAAREDPLPREEGRDGAAGAGHPVRHHGPDHGHHEVVRYRARRPAGARRAVPADRRRRRAGRDASRRGWRSDDFRAAQAEPQARAPRQPQGRCSCPTACPRSSR